MNFGPYSNRSERDDARRGGQPGADGAGNLTATAVELEPDRPVWPAATDNVGVTGYRVERCQGAGCAGLRRDREASRRRSTATSASRQGPATPTACEPSMPRATSAPSRRSRARRRRRARPRRRLRLQRGHRHDGRGFLGPGNAGTILNTTWTTFGKFGNALTFSGTNARVNVPDAPSLRLTTSMTLEAWVYPTTVNAAWRDVIYKGDDNYYLSGTSASSGRPAVGAIIGGGYGKPMAPPPSRPTPGRISRPPTTGQRCGFTSTAFRSRASPARAP